MSSCDFEPETTDHYLLRCKLYTDLRLDLLNNIYTIDQSLKNFPKDQLVKGRFINMKQFLAILWTFELLLYFDQLFSSNLQSED